MVIEKLLIHNFSYCFKADPELEFLVFQVNRYKNRGHNELQIEKNYKEVKKILNKNLKEFFVIPFVVVLLNIGKYLNFFKKS